MWRQRLSTPLGAALVGVVGVAVAVLIAALIPGNVPSEVPALLLLVPITASSVLSNWRVGVPVAVLGGVVHSLTFIPPLGRIRLGYTQDVLTIVTFVAVAVIVSVLVSRRSIASRAELIGRERLALLGSISHDFRSPLTVILTASTELLDGADHDAATRRRLLGLVVDETERLNRLVTTVLDLGRLQAGVLEPSRERVAIADLLRESKVRLERLARSGDRVVVDEPLPDVEIDADPVQLDQVLANLVENAVRHTPRPVTVTIGASAGDHEVVVRVDDDGLGFSPTARAGLFSPYRSSTTSSGLGLTVCKAIVEAHGGTITVHDGQAGGTSIRFTVPRAA